MGWLIDFFHWLGDIITMCVDFVMSLFENFILLFEYIGLVVEIAYNFIATMPSWLQAFGTITIVVSVIYIILGRQTGGKHE